MVLAAAEYPFLNIFWTMIIFFSWVIWIWIVIGVLADVFARKDISGWSKAGWCVFVIVLPFFGVLTYLIIHSSDMADRKAQAYAGRAPVRDGRRRRRDREGQAAPRRERDHAGRVRRAQGQGPRRLAQPARGEDDAEGERAGTWCPGAGRDDGPAHARPAVLRRHPDAAAGRRDGRRRARSTAPRRSHRLSRGGAPHPRDTCARHWRCGAPRGDSGTCPIMPPKIPSQSSAAPAGS